MSTLVKFTHNGKTTLTEDKRDIFQIVLDFVKWNENRKLQACQHQKEIANI